MLGADRVLIPFQDLLNVWSRRDSPVADRRVIFQRRLVISYHLLVLEVLLRGVVAADPVYDSAWQVRLAIVWDPPRDITAL